MQIKSFFIIVFFMLVLALLVFGSMSSNDLTPNTPPAPVQESAFSQTIPLSSVSNQSALAASASGNCPPVYTVQSGDTLSAISRACGITLNALIAANPAITNPHLIRPGQVIAIPGGTGVVLPNSGGSSGSNAASSYVDSNTASAPSTVFQFEVPDSLSPIPGSETIPPGLVPGGMLHARARGLPPNLEVTIGVGKVGTIPMHVDKAVTDAQGSLDVTVAIPKRAKPGEQWQVSIISEKRPFLEIASVPFTIEP